MDSFVGSHQLGEKHGWRKETAPSICGDTCGHVCRCTDDEETDVSSKLGNP